MYQKEKIKCLQWILVPIFIIGIFFFVKNVYAFNPVYSIEQNNQNTALNRDITCQTFIPTTELFNGVGVYQQSQTNQELNYDLYFCLGDLSTYATSTYGVEQAYNCNNFTFIASTSVTSTQNSWNNFILTNQSLNTGSTYYFCLYNPPGKNEGWQIHTSNQYDDGKVISANPGYSEYWASGDMKFRIFYDDDLIESEYNWSYEWFDLESDYPDFYMPIQQICFTSSVDEYCNLEYWYNSQSIGSTLNFVYDNGQPIRPLYAATSTIITYTSGNQSILYLESQDEATTTPFCLYLENDSYGDISQCGYVIEWVDASYFPEMPDAFCSSSTDPCSEISTSTFGGEIECGLKKIGQWLVCPSDESFNSLQTTYSMWQQIFPYSIFSQITDTFLNIQATTTSFDLKLSIIDESAEDAVIYRQGLLTEKFPVFWERFVFIQQSILYILTFIYLVWRIKKLGSKKDDI